MLSGHGNPMNSYIYAFYLSAENGHDYFAIGCHCAKGLDHMCSYVSLLDINTTQYYGTSNFVPGTIGNETYDVDGGGLHMYATTDDMLSEMQVESTVPGASYNLTITPKGSPLFYAGSGSFFWATNINNQWAIPDAWVTGKIVVNDTEVSILPEKSRCWFDRQWGTGLAYNGWFWFNIMLDNGINLGVWVTEPINGTTAVSSFATVQFPDGHHEVHLVDHDIKPTGAFTSSATNLTYYTHFELNMPTMRAKLNAYIPVAKGEMTFREQPISSRTLFEGFTIFSGTMAGAKVSGYGLTEKLYLLRA